jgi:hypothetical protein
MKKTIFILLVCLINLSTITFAQQTIPEERDHVTVEDDVGVNSVLTNVEVSDEFKNISEAIYSYSLDSFVLENNEVDQLVLAAYHYASDDFVNKLNSIALKSYANSKIPRAPEIQSLYKCINIKETKHFVNKLLNDEGGLLSLFQSNVGSALRI